MKAWIVEDRVVLGALGALAQLEATPLEAAPWEAATDGRRSVRRCPPPVATASWLATGGRTRATRRTAGDSSRTAYAPFRRSLNPATGEQDTRGHEDVARRAALIDRDLDRAGGCVRG